MFFVRTIFRVVRIISQPCTSCILCTRPAVKASNPVVVHHQRSVTHTQWSGYPQVADVHGALCSTTSTFGISGVPPYGLPFSSLSRMFSADTVTIKIRQPDDIVPHLMDIAWLKVMRVSHIFISTVINEPRRSL